MRFGEGRVSRQLVAGLVAVRMALTRVAARLSALIRQRWRRVATITLICCGVLLTQLNNIVGILKDGPGLLRTDAPASPVAAAASPAPAAPPPPAGTNRTTAEPADMAQPEAERQEAGAAGPAIAPEIVFRPVITMPDPVVRPAPEPPVVTSGRRIVVANKCDAPVQVALMFEIGDGRWPARGFWVVKPGEETTFRLGADYPMDYPVATDNPQVYLYAWGGPQRVWSGDGNTAARTGLVDGKAYSFMPAKVSPYGTAYWLLSLSCPTTPDSASATNTARRRIGPE